MLVTKVRCVLRLFPASKKCVGTWTGKQPTNPKVLQFLRCLVGYPLGWERLREKNPDRKPGSCILQKGHCHRKLIVVVAICWDLPLSSCRFFVALWITPWVGKTMGVNPDRQICSRIVQKGHCLKSTTCGFGHMLRPAIYCPVVRVFCENSCLLSDFHGLVEPGGESY